MAQVLGSLVYIYALCPCFLPCAILGRLDTLYYHSVDMNGAMSLINNQKEYFPVSLQDFSKFCLKFNDSVDMNY